MSIPRESEFLARVQSRDVWLVAGLQFLTLLAGYGMALRHWSVAVIGFLGSIPLYSIIVDRLRKFRELKERVVWCDHCDHFKDVCVCEKV